MHMAVAVQASGDPTALITAVRAQVRALDPHLPIAHVQTLRSLVNDSMSRTSFILLMLGIAAAVALLLSVVGIYGVISYVVGQRRREIGVRMALGATARDVRRMVVRQGVMLGAAGVIVGLIAALGLSRLLRTLLFGVSASDPVTYGLVAAALLGVTVLASYLPARRASAMDPTEALRGG
jgi:ABC-type antimicrobial peptide transport system permease subunit